jgi:hypothetical protein
MKGDIEANSNFLARCIRWKNKGIFRHSKGGVVPKKRVLNGNYRWRVILGKGGKKVVKNIRAPSTVMLNNFKGVGGMP